MRVITLIILTLFSTVSYSKIDYFGYEVKSSGDVNVFKYGRSFNDIENLLAIKLDLSKDYYLKNTSHNYKEFYNRINEIQLLASCLIIQDGGHGLQSHTGYSSIVDVWNIFTKKRVSFNVNSPYEFWTASGDNWGVLIRNSSGRLEDAKVLTKNCDIKDISIPKLNGYFEVVRGIEHMEIKSDNLSVLIDAEGNVQKK